MVPTVIVALLGLLLVIVKGRYRPKMKRMLGNQASQTSEYKTKHWDYQRLSTMISENNIPLPAMFVDVDVLDANIKKIVDIVRPTGKTLRLATKSVRCPVLIQRIVERGEGVFRGLMCFTVKEADLLAEHGLDDFYIPYPTLQISDVRTAYHMTTAGRKVTLTVDCPQHVSLLDSMWEQLSSEPSEDRHKRMKLRVAIDLDTSYRGLMLNEAGAHRSRVDSLETFKALAMSIQHSNRLLLVGVMGYEAHIAGLPDDNPHSPVPNFLLRILKPLFYSRVTSLRKAVADYCKQDLNVRLDFFNGGGSGNIKAACDDDAITEVSAGSAFLQAAIFDYFVSNECSPALMFALQTTRVAEDFICCQSGGFIASGPTSKDKNPVPFLNPIQLEPFPDEGFGEVQTPLKIIQSTGPAIGLGKPVFFRPAKSGEIAERFNVYYTKIGYDITGTVDTYRGLGKAFY